MAQHFLTKSQIDIGQCLDFADGLALEAYPTLHQILLTRAGPEAARLFAEPLISRGNDVAPPTVSWYTDVDGEGQPMNRLDDAAQSALGAELSRQMRALRDAVDDPDDGPLIAAALHLRDASDVWSVSGRPVIINWGMMPKDIGRDPASRAAHYQRTLGRFLPLDAAPPLTTAERQQRRDRQASTARSETPSSAAVAPVAAGAAVAGAAGAATAAGPGAAGAGTPPDPPRRPDDEARRRVPLGAWLPLVLLLLLAGGTLAWLLIPGNRIFPDRPEIVAITDEAAVAAAEDSNRALEERLQSLQRALDGAVCEPDGTLLMPDGYTIEGLLPPDPQDPDDGAGAIREASPRPILPPDPARVQVPDVAGHQDTATLLAHVEERTAIVLAQGAEVATGTGFFVGPDLLVTNFHVIENADPQGIFVTNKALGTVHQAQVLKTLGPMERTGGDFALLRVPGVNQPAFGVLQSAETLRLQPVIAAGYPGDLLRTDAQFRQLQQGNADAVPELAVTDGTVSTEQEMSPQTSVVVHSAPISNGNSGGPLIDMCGRLVGVNTFVVQGPLRNLNFALSAGDLMRFLSGTDALPQVISQTCQPLLARPQPPVASASLETQEPPQIPQLELEDE